MFLKAYQHGREAKAALADYFRFHNDQRSRQARAAAHRQRKPDAIK